VKGAVALLLLVLGCGGGAGPATRVVPAQRQDLIVDVEVTGTLKAVDSEMVGPPSIAETWEFKIIRMAAEGTQAKVGDEVLAFDPSDLERRLKDYESEVAAVTEELGKLRAEGDLTILADHLTEQEAQAKQRKADLKADKPPDLTAALTSRAAVIERDMARREVAFAQRRDQARRAQEAASRAVLASQLELARGRVAAVKAAIGQMSVRAQRAGTVVHRQDWRGEKKKVGDGTWRAESVLEIASLDRMAAVGQVDEVDASRVSVGQRVGLRLEAHPEREYGGVVDRVASLVQTESPESRVKVVQLELGLETTDPLLMRPGMRFRGRIEVSRAPRVLQIPLEAVRSAPGGPTVLRLAGGTPRDTPVKLGRRSREAVEVLDGLAEGDKVVLPAAGAAKDNGFRLGES
jgi:HlyD family secretion protein